MDEDAPRSLHLPEIENMGACSQENRSSHKGKREAKRDPGMRRREETLGHLLGCVTLEDVRL